MKTTVVGSYPVYPSEEYIAECYAELKDPCPKTIKACVADQVLAGINIVSTGQTRADMIALFTRGISGIRNRNHKPAVMRKIGYKWPIRLNDIVYSKEFLPKHTQIKGILTGPFTLAHSCDNYYYDNIKDLAFDFAKILNEEAKTIQDEVEYIQIDEPSFSNELPDYAQELVGVVFDGVKTEKAMHVCGDVSDIFETLTKFDVDILDHEFARNPGLLEKIGKYKFRQKIGFGCLDTAGGKVEEVETIKARIQKAIDVLGQERLIIDPDCGLRNFSREDAYQSLENMVRATREILGIKYIKAKRKPLDQEDWDEAGYFYIIKDERKGVIRVEHYSYDHVCDSVIEGKKAEPILHEIQRRNLVAVTSNGLRHLGYLGTELKDFEIALEYDLRKTQDKPLRIKKADFS